MRTKPVSRYAAALLAATALHMTAALAADGPLVDAARKEGRVVIYTNVGNERSDGLIAAFKRKYPEIKVDYNDLGSNGTYNRIVAEAAAKQVVGDVVWGSAVDLQIRLALDGQLQPTVLPATTALPGWANYRNTLYATSIEPLGIIYNKRLLAQEDVPHSRAELLALLKSGKVDHKVATSDPTKGSAYFYHVTDDPLTGSYWELAQAFGKAYGKTYTSATALKEGVVSGENVLAFKVVGSYALDWIKTTPNLGLSFEKDAAIGFSRLIGRMKDAPHPNAGSLFIDFVVSKEGQGLLASKGFPSIRDDVATGLNIKSLNELVGGKLLPIHLNDTDIASLIDARQRMAFSQKWNRTAAPRQ